MKEYKTATLTVKDENGQEQTIPAFANNSSGGEVWEDITPVALQPSGAYQQLFDKPYKKIHCEVISEGLSNMRAFPETSGINLYVMINATDTLPPKIIVKSDDGWGSPLNNGIDIVTCGYRTIVDLEITGFGVKGEMHIGNPKMELYGLPDGTFGNVERPAHDGKYYEYDKYGLLPNINSITSFMLMGAGEGLGFDIDTFNIKLKGVAL